MPAGEEGDRVCGEEELIRDYLAPLTRGTAGALDLSDDCALYRPEVGRELVLKTDPVIAGVHFFADDPPEHIAWKALAVNVSDLAAKGARPEVFLMALAFPEAPERAWMRRFADGLAAAQAQLGCRLLGGDTDRAPASPLTIAITVIGSVPIGRMVRRGGARPGDRLFVSGTIGDSGLGLRVRQREIDERWGLGPEEMEVLLHRYQRPRPRLALGLALMEYASAAMDLSDGLVRDAGRMCRASGVDATIELAKVPVCAPARRLLDDGHADIAALITAGDDYEILAAVPPGAVAAFTAAAVAVGVPVQDIGVCRNGNGRLDVVSALGVRLVLDRDGHDHFAVARSRRAQ